MNDPNGDGLATVDEDWADISTYFDADKDGCATVDEWIPRWTKFYGFSENHARAFYQAVNDGDGCVTRDDVVRNFQNQSSVPSTFFPNLLVQIIVGMCEADPALYETDTDCAQIADTCRQFFSQNAACKVYMDECGLQNYQKCIKQLPWSGECRADRDQIEVHLEDLRTDNQMLPGPQCKNYQ